MKKGGERVERVERGSGEGRKNVLATSCTAPMSAICVDECGLAVPLAALDEQMAAARIA